MSTLLSSRSLYYKDVNLIAQPGKVKSRYDDIPKELYRIMVAPMSAVVGKAFAKEATELGLQVCLPRFCSVDQQLAMFECAGKFKGSLWASIGFDDNDRFQALLMAGCYQFVIDVANGYLPGLADMIKRLTDESGIRLIVGNVHTKEGYANLVGEGRRDILTRVGIGNGSACGTSDVTGVGRGQITELMECNLHRLERQYLYGDIIADGGVIDAGCAAKAFGCGAAYVMMGGYFRNAAEAENIVKGDFSYWGGASHKQQILQYGEIRRHSEGKVIEVDPAEVRPLKRLVDDLWGGLSSSVSYCGHETLSDFIGKGVFEIKA